DARRRLPRGGGQTQRRAHRFRAPARLFALGGHRRAQRPVRRLGGRRRLAGGRCELYANEHRRRRARRRRAHRRSRLFCRRCPRRPVLCTHRERHCAPRPQHRRRHHGEWRFDAVCRCALFGSAAGAPHVGQYPGRLRAQHRYGEGVVNMRAQTLAADPAARSVRTPNRFRLRTRFAAIWIAMLGLIVFCAIVAPRSLLPSTFLAIIPLAAFLAIAAIGETLVLMARGIDLSIPAVVTLSSTIVLGFSGGHDEAILTAVCGALLFATLIGLING